MKSSAVADEGFEIKAMESLRENGFGNTRGTSKRERLTEHKCLSLAYTYQ